MSIICNFPSISSSLIALLLLCLTSNNNRIYVQAETEAGIIYSCCHLQETYNGISCNTCNAIGMESYTSEFDTNFHSALWKVPKRFHQSQSNLRLRVETRNASDNYCPAKFRIQGTFEHNSTDIKGPTKFSDNEISDNDSNKIFPVFLKNGSMFYNNRLYSPLEYCLDRRTENGESTLLDIAVYESGGDCKPLHEISFSIRQPYHEKWINQLFAAVSGLSCLFTILNVIIYLSLRNYLNVSGWVEFTYFLALGVFSAFSIPAFLYYEPTSHDGFCYVISVVLQFSEIMAYSSYFMIAFDVYWILRKSDTFASYGEEIEESKIRLIVYVFLLLAIPIGVTTYGIVLNNESNSLEDYKMPIVPLYGEKSCFAPTWLVSEYLLFSIESATLIVILLSVNHIFARLSVSADVEDATRVSLLSNMFFFTLSYWIMDLLKFARPLLVGKNSHGNPDAETFWIVLDGFNYGQGMIAFVVFVFNRKTLKAFRKKAGTDGTMRAIFRHACCSDGRVEAQDDEGGTPLSPLMKRSSIRRATVRQNNRY